MATGYDLFSLKQDAISAKNNANERSMRIAGWVPLSWLVSVVAFGFAVGATLISWDGNTAFGFGAVALFAVSGFMFALPFMVEEKDKELNRLNKVAEEASESYLSALMIEATAYGIAPEGRFSHTGHMDQNYEFTALRNGAPIDVTVREFNDEIIFMLNGERMQKPVAV